MTYYLSKGRNRKINFCLFVFRSDFKPCQRVLVSLKLNSFVLYKLDYLKAIIYYSLGEKNPILIFFSHSPHILICKRA